MESVVYRGNDCDRRCPRFYNENGKHKKFLDSMLGFAAGSMIFVVAEEVIPSSKENGNTDLASVSLIVGFIIMMILDVALG